MELKSKKHLFRLSENVTYLNGSYMSPLLKSVEQIGRDSIAIKLNPQNLTESDFFTGQIILKKRFAQLIVAEDYQNIAIIPSASYGISIAANNISFQKGDEVLVLNEQFPSNIYAWKRREQETGCIVKTIEAPGIGPNRAKKWNELLLNAINPKTKVVAIPQLHWADGTYFDLKTIREKTNLVDAYLIIDGTQSIGAFPFSVKELQPDAVICAGYKWLMGPYSSGAAYFSDRFNEGKPIEESWMNHEGRENFSELVNYNYNYTEKAGRYDVGQSSNFILTPMLSEGIKQVLELTPQYIQTYCKFISEKAIQELRSLGCFIEDESFRGHHLFGVYLPQHLEISEIKNKLSKSNVFVSYRGNAIRISPNIYNTEDDLLKLVACFR
ncbi:MAG: aminotransferase class V-fold PLP-dependent enzyme [Flavobacteriaceae bacterium]|nr:aminotransferase class V-fold PLP-dependent enzyme [Flavobacteriaceae bacterium]